MMVIVSDVRIHGGWAAKICAWVADITRARPTLRAVVCVAVNFFPFLKIFLSVFDFSKGKKHFFQKISNNGLVSKKIEKNLSLSRGEGGQDPK